MSKFLHFARSIFFYNVMHSHSLISCVAISPDSIIILKPDVSDMASSCPVSTIPTEILTDIFCQFIDLDLSPWILAKVCWRWYQAVMNTPYLWSSIVITDHFLGRHGKKKDEPRSKGRYHLCINLYDLEAVLERAKVYPLTVHIQYSYAVESKNTMALNPSVLRRLFREDTVTQIVNLDLDINSHVIFDHLAMSPATRLSSLRTLTVSHETMLSTTLVDLVTQTAVNLEEIIFPIAYDIPEIWVKSKIWPRLKTICFPRSRSSTLDRILPFCTSLIRLNNRTVDWPIKTSPKIVFEHLRELEGHCQNFTHLSQLKLPVLRQLYIRNYDYGGSKDYSNLQETLMVSIDLPQLHTLEARMSTPFWLASFKMPNLVHLKIDATDIDYLVRLHQKKTPYTFSLSFPSVHTLILNGTAFGTDTIRLLEALPNAQMVQISLGTRYQSPETLEGTLLHSLTGGDSQGDTPLLPGLKDFTLGSYDCPVAIPKDLTTNRIRELLKVRKMRQLPLERVTVHWQKQSEGGEMGHFE